jgi:uncharacterized membrane protein
MTLAAVVGSQMRSSDFIETMADSAKFIYDEAKSQARYGFRTLPDILLSGSLFLTFMLGWQQSLATFSGGIIFTGLSQSFVADRVLKTTPSLAKVGGVLGGGVDACSGHFPGVTWSRMGTVLKNPRAMLEGAVPTYYMSVMGYIFSFVMAQSYLFKDELSMRPTTEEWLKVFSVICGIAIVSIGILRVVIDCEPWWSTIMSSLFGILVGIIFIGICVYLFGRRSVNVLQIPLLTKRIQDSQPIYICAEK